jgi:hypothetical protein
MTFCWALFSVRGAGAVIGEGGILMTSEEHVVLTRAAEQFPDLTDAEKILLHAVFAGEVANYSSPNDDENNPQHAGTWGASRTIRAKVIRWLCGDPEATRQIDPHGIYIDAATIEGQLDLAFMTIPVPFALRRCAVKAGVNLAYADTRMLRFSGSVLGGSGGIALNAAGAQIRGDTFLDSGFRAEGEVRLLGASIGGQLTCRRGTFRRPRGPALGVDGAQVGGAAFLDDGFRAEGEVRLVNGRVGPLFDDEASWPAHGNLQLDGFVYTTIAAGPIDAKARLAWLARQPSTPFRPQPYQQLAKVLRESGHEAAAKRILIAQEKARRKHGELGWLAWGKSMLLGATIAHGYRPSQALLWAAFWVAIGGGLFGWGYDKGIVIPTKAEAYDSNKKIRQEPAFYPAFNRWLYALDTFVPIINFGQKDYWAPQVDCYERIPKGDPKGEERIKTGLIRGGGIRLCILGILNKPAIRVLYLYRWLHIVAGWVLITLFVTGFTNLVRRQ